MAFKTAIDEGQDLSDDLKIINQKIKENSKNIQDFCNATGYKRDRFRESINPKTSVGHGSGKTQKYINTLKNGLTSAQNGGKIKPKEMYRAKDTHRTDYKIISEDTFKKLTIQARKNGAIILRGTTEIEKHLNDMNANASNIGDVLMFRKEVCLSEVLEETYHFMQNKAGLNDDKPEPLRTYLNEIDAKQYLIDNTNKFKIPRNETELTKKQLEEYKTALNNYLKEHEEYD